MSSGRACPLLPLSRCLMEPTGRAPLRQLPGPARPGAVSSSVGGRRWNAGQEVIGDCVMRLIPGGPSRRQDASVRPRRSVRTLNRHCTTICCHSAFRRSVLPSYITQHRCSASICFRFCLTLVSSHSTAEHSQKASCCWFNLTKFDLV